MAARFLLASGVALALLGGSGCSPCSQSRDCEIDPVTDTGGQVSPSAAAQWFAVHGGVWSDVPTTGWRVVGQSSQGASVRSGSMTLQVTEGADGTWFVVSGSEPDC